MLALHPRTDNLTGQQFGRLLVLRFDGYRKVGRFSSAHWWCQCRCGAEKAVQARFLKNGLTVSCGCVQRERASELNRKPPGVAGFNRLYRSYKDGAANRGIRFELSKTQARQIFEGVCEYCGVEPLQESKCCSGGPRDTSSYSTFVYNGIDRVDNTTGYTIDNCVSCCSICNQAKHTMTVAQFLEWVERIASHQGFGG